MGTLIAVNLANGLEAIGMTGFGALIARMAVFVPVFWIAWVLILAVFYFTGADVGPGMPVHLSK